MKQCVTCGEFKEEEAFNWRYKALGQRHKICRDCQSQHAKNWYDSHREQHIENTRKNRDRVREETRDWVWEYLKTHPCEVCGESDPVVLEFDHLGGKDKEVSLMVSQGYSLDAIKREIEKCHVLCANCHRRKTSDERGWFRGK